MKPGMVTQAGKAKVMGAKSWLARFGVPTAHQKVQLKSAFEAKINKVLRNPMRLPGAFATSLLCTTRNEDRHGRDILPTSSR